MRKIFFMAACIIMTACDVFGQSTITLPKPSNTVSMTLTEALMKRKSMREFSSKPVSEAVLSQVLWAACGINRPSEKKITAPSAMNKQDITVYVVREDGAFEYLPVENALRKVSSKDLRSAVAGRQQSVAEAPVSLVLVSDQAKLGSDNDALSSLDAGYVSQNICLMCTALGLNTVPRGTMDKENLAKGLKLKSTDKLIVNNPIGWSK